MAIMLQQIDSKRTARYIMEFNYSYFYEKRSSMLNKIESWVKDIPISAEAFGFAAVVASVAPVPDAVLALIFNVRYLLMSHSIWAVFSSLAPIVILLLTVLAFCKNSWKIAAAGTAVTLVSFIFRGCYGTTVPVLLLACTALCMLIFTVKTSNTKRV